MIYMRYPEGKKKALTLSYDDGTIHDIRLIGIMKKYGLKGTFNINSGMYEPEGKVRWRMSRSMAHEVYVNSGMEVAVHGLNHPYLEQLPENMRTYEVLQDRINLEEEYGTIIRGMAYPYGTLSDSVVETLKKCGIAYARTIVSTEKFSVPTDWLRMPATCEHTNPKLMKLAREFAENTANKVPELFLLWGHSWVFDCYDNWNVMEEFAGYMGQRESIWYATNIEIYDYITAYHQLQFSVNGKRIYNPTNTVLYMEADGRIRCLKPGETICRRNGL